MAYYNNPNYFRQSNNEAFNYYYNPGISTPYSGIYRCGGCAHEITSIYGNPLPPQNHHEHSFAQGSIRWELIVSPKEP